MSKQRLASGATSVTVTQIDTSRAAPGDKPGFTVWPAQSPTAAQYDLSANGTQYFLSTNAAEEVGTGSSSDLLTWSVTNTASLDAAGAPALNLNVVSTPVSPYAVPLPAVQKAGPVPLADCLNVTWCAKTVWGTPDRYKESERPVDALDSRMQQVMYANGLLYGSNGTAVDVGVDAVERRSASRRCVVCHRPDHGCQRQPRHGGRAAGPLGDGPQQRGHAIAGVRADGSAVIGVTLVGLDHYPSAAYVNLTGAGPGRSMSSPKGPAPKTGSPVTGSPSTAHGGATTGRPRSIPLQVNLWVANEWIAQSCTFAQYQAAPFGQCGGTRTALANWSTRITLVG